MRQEGVRVASGRRQDNLASGWRQDDVKRRGARIRCLTLFTLASEGAFLLALVNFETLLSLVNGVSILTPILAKQKFKPSLKLSLKRQ